jgi:hypothetical protein
MHVLLNPAIDFVAESESQAMQRYHGFCSSFFERLYSDLPALKGGFHFFRDAAANDIWAIFDGHDAGFGVQLDPDIEVICLWNKSQSEEIGSWVDDPIADAIERIRNTYAAHILRQSRTEE